MVATRSRGSKACENAPTGDVTNAQLGVSAPFSTNVPVAHLDKGRRLHGHEAIGDHARYMHILKGYRDDYSVAQALRSVFSWHNETVRSNARSHSTSRRGRAAPVVTADHVYLEVPLLYPPVAVESIRGSSSSADQHLDTRPGTRVLCRADAHRANRYVVAHDWPPHRAIE